MQPNAYFSYKETKSHNELLMMTRSSYLGLTKRALSLLFMMGFLSFSFSSFGQDVGDYRSAATGDWKELSTWERWNGAAWVTPLALYPVVAGTESSAKTDIAGTTHTVSLPSGIAVNDLLIIFWSDANDVATAPTTPSGWTELYTDTNGNSNCTTWYKTAIGTEGATLDITAGAERSAHNSYRISAGSYINTPEVGVPSTVSSATPDPPNLNLVFPFANHTLWIAASHSQGDDNSSTPTAPTDYSDLLSGYTGSGTSHARMLTARRERSTTSEDPSFFTLGSVVAHAANTVGINGVVIPAGEGAPSTSSGAITILSGHTVTVSAPTSADQLVIGAGGQVTVISDHTLTIDDGTGTDLTVNGTLSNAGTITNNGTIAFGDGGTYEHDQNGGAIPSATWDANSTCQIIGATDTDPTNTTQNFGHFTWNCPSQTGNRLFQGDAAFSIQGNLNVVSTGTGELWLRDDKANVVGGNFTQSGGVLVNRLDGSRSLTVSGNFELSGGTLRNDGNASPGGVLNVAGNFLHSGGTLDGGNLLNIVFNGSAQELTKALISTLSGTVNITVNSGSNVNIGTSQLSIDEFTLSAGGTMQATVNSLASFGQITSSGDVITAGTITANFGDFVPTMGDMINIISGAASYTGTPTISTTSNTHQIAATYAGGVLSIGGVILPIELISFEGKRVDQSVELTWTTATELNNEKFIIEHSTDGRAYNSIGEMSGSGTSFKQQDYHFMDKNPATGVNYYRLKQVDYDGKYEYTKVVSVEVERESSSINLFPNPATGTVTVTIASDYTGEARLNLYDRLGRQIKTQELVLDNGAIQTSIELSSLPSGIYLVEISIGAEKWQERLVVE